MGKGYSLARGFMIEYTWEPSLRALSPENFHRTFWALCDYQKSEGESTLPDPSEGSAGIACSLIKSQLDNRLRGSRGGKNANENEEDGGRVGGTVPPTLPGTVGNKDKYKYKDKIQVQDDDTRAYACEDAPHRSSSERDEDSEEVFRIYGELCPSLVPVKRISPKLRESIRKARTRFSMEDLRQLFTKAEATPFLRGEGERGWKASLSWVLENADEILSGSYDNYKKPKPPGAAIESSFETDEFFETALRRTYGPLASNAADND